MRTIALVILVGTAVPTFALTIEEAYRLVPHQQTVFQSTSARMAALERVYLVSFFNAIDQAIVAKVSSRKGSTVAQAYAPVWKAWAELKPPAALRGIQDKVKAAIEDQQAFLLELETHRTNWNMNHPKVRSSSGNLQGAYSDLMRIYPSENATNKQAFFDYLCALDFV